MLAVINEQTDDILSDDEAVIVIVEGEERLPNS